MLIERGEIDPPPPDEELVGRFHPHVERNEAVRGGRQNRGQAARTALINTHFAAMAER